MKKACLVYKKADAELNRFFINELTRYLGENNISCQLVFYEDLYEDPDDNIYGDLHENIHETVSEKTSVIVNNVLSEIDNLGIRTSYGSVSFRQNEDYEYLKTCLYLLYSQVVSCLAIQHISALSQYDPLTETFHRNPQVKYTL